jgi:hypothetical protein
VLSFEVLTEAVTLAAIFFGTGTVVTVKVVEVEPEGTVTVAGVIRAALFDASETFTPPELALADKVTVPVALAPPTTEVGENVSLDTFWARLT